MRRGLVWTAVSGVCVVLCTGSADAQGQPPARTTLAQSLFEEAGQLMRAGRYAEACPKLAESHRLDPASGTIFNLALCFEHDHKLASAYVAYDEALARAIQDRQREREALIRGRQEALRPRVSKLVVHVDAATRSLPGLEVRLDDEGLRPQAWAVPVPVDAGLHVVEARAPRSTSFRRELSITDEGKVYEVTVPALATAPEATKAPAPADPKLPPPTVSHEGSAGRRVIGFLLGGTSVAFLAAGTISGVLAIDRHAESNRLCPQGRCNAEGVEAEEAADRFAWGANVGIGAGLIVGAVGAYFLFSSPSPSPTTTSSPPRLALLPTPWGATLTGRFE